jgi:hypothetical protein
MLCTWKAAEALLQALKRLGGPVSGEAEALAKRHAAAGAPACRRYLTSGRLLALALKFCSP